MSECDGTAVDIYFLLIQSGLADHRQGLLLEGEPALEDRALPAQRALQARHVGFMHTPTGPCGFRRGDAGGR